MQPAHSQLGALGLALADLVGWVGMLLFLGIIVLAKACGRLMERLRSRKLRLVLAAVAAAVAIVLLAGYLLLGLLPGDTFMLLVLIAYSPFDNGIFFRI